MDTEEYKKVMKSIPRYGSAGVADATGQAKQSADYQTGWDDIKGSGSDVQEYNEEMARFRAAAKKADEVTNVKRDTGGGKKLTLSDRVTKPPVSDADIEKGVAKPKKKAKDNLNARVKARGQGKVHSRFSDDVRGMSAKELKGSGFKQYENKPYEKVKSKAKGFSEGGQVRGAGIAQKGIRPAKMR